MNREIKFRAWNGGKMYYFDLSDTIAPSLTNIVMQYTGLQDCNGIDIYEGDIMTGNRKEFTTIRFCVSFGETNTNWDCDTATLGWINNYNESLLDLLKTNLKIIGNIYENPELMELKND